MSESVSGAGVSVAQFVPLAALTVFVEDNYVLFSRIGEVRCWTRLIQRYT